MPVQPSPFSRGESPSRKHRIAAHSSAARTAELQAMADYNKILAQLSFAEGSILEKHHLNLEIK